jgi:hypothetical protein
MAPDDVGIEVIVDGSPAGRTAASVLRLAWNRSDPLAVRLTLQGIPDHPALYGGSWVVLRDFLRYGLEEPTGDGDVRISPDGEQQRVRFDLGGGGGRPGTVWLPARTLEGFLAATEALIPTGTDAEERLVDALIERLLER